MRFSKTTCVIAMVLGGCFGVGWTGSFKVAAQEEPNELNAILRAWEKRQAIAKSARYQLSGKWIHPAGCYTGDPALPSHHRGPPQMVVFQRKDDQTYVVAPDGKTLVPFGQPVPS